MGFFVVVVVSFFSSWLVWLVEFCPEIGNGGEGKAMNNRGKLGVFLDHL